MNYILYMFLCQQYQIYTITATTEKTWRAIRQLEVVDPLSIFDLQPL